MYRRYARNQSEGLVMPSPLAVKAQGTATASVAQSIGQLTISSVPR